MGDYRQAMIMDNVGSTAPLSSLENKPQGCWVRFSVFWQLKYLSFQKNGVPHPTPLWFVSTHLIVGYAHY